MIYIGLTGWGDHDSLYTDVTKVNQKLETYAGTFPVVEVDSTYYAILQQSTIEKWCRETPEDFKFIVKTHQFMTGHGDFRTSYSNINELYKDYKEMLQPIVNHGKLAYILMQFPPWYECNEKNINYVRLAKKMLHPLKVAVEFRHASWFTDDKKEQTLQFLHDNRLIHTIVDAPQIGEGTVPFVSRVTDDIGFIRLHGRNAHGWMQMNRTREEWRNVRYLYNYNREELEALKKHIEILSFKTKDIYVIFNNNSGGHAAGNAETLIDMLGIKYKTLAPKQLKLF